MEFSELIAQKVKDLRPSGIRKFFDLLETMEDAISLGVGEPDFQTGTSGTRASIPWKRASQNIRPTRA